MSRQEIAVIGGGPKAAAIAAKAWCMREAKLADVNVTIFEKLGLAAHWDGQHGYTDGLQLLCTPPERDLGFPYDQERSNPAVTKLMHAEFSWAAHLLRSDRLGYAEWVGSGRKRPRHTAWAGYVVDSIERSDAKVEYAEVTGLTRSGDGWVVSAVDASGSHGTFSTFDGVVVTSPGPSIDRLNGPPIDDRILDGDSFWRNLPQVRARASSMEAPAVVIGGGGTAAAVAAWLIDNGFRDKPIVMLSPRPAPTFRVENRFENILFDDEDAWAALPITARQEFVESLTRGTVWANILPQLETATALTFALGRAVGVRTNKVILTDELPDLTIEIEGDVEPIEAGLVVDAAGFDNWWFLRLLQSAVTTFTRQALATAMTVDLDFSDPALAGLHAPLVSQMIGPGFGSLMVLGAMADHVLARYVARSRA